MRQSWNALPSSTIRSSWKKLWPNIVENPSNEPQITVTPEIINQVRRILKSGAVEWIMRKIFVSEVFDEEIIKEISSYKTINGHNDEVFVTTRQVTP